MIYGLSLKNHKVLGGHELAALRVWHIPALGLAASFLCQQLHCKFEQAMCATQAYEHRISTCLGLPCKQMALSGCVIGQFCDAQPPCVGTSCEL